jgi:hypothetical protein
MSSTTAVALDMNVSISGVRFLINTPAVDGIAIPIEASSSNDPQVMLLVASNVCILWYMPPKKKQQPSWVRI